MNMENKRTDVSDYTFERKLFNFAKLIVPSMEKLFIEQTYIFVPTYKIVILPTIPYDIFTNQCK